MAISRMTSVIDDALKFIKRKLYFLADYIGTSICQSAERERPDQAKQDIKLNESNHGSPTGRFISVSFKLSRQQPLSH